jgi:membrane fusion protein, epimerase transport system
MNTIAHPAGLSTDSMFPPMPTEPTLEPNPAKLGKIGMALPSLPMPSAKAARASHITQAKRLTRAGWLVVLGAILPIGAWTAMAPLSLAVIAPGFVRVDLNRRPVQHLEGGIVREVLVRDGQMVKAGEPVLLLGNVGVDADSNRVDFRVASERAALARLEAEQRLVSSISYPADLLTMARKDVRVKQAIDKEQSLFNTRRESLRSEIALLGEQRQRIDQEMSAMRAQIAHAKNSYELQQKDLDSNRKLAGDGFISSAKVTQQEATVVDYAAKLEQHNSELLRAQQRVGDIDLKVKTIQNEFSKSASDQLKQTAARLSEFEQEQRKYGDAASRQVVTAPAAGEVIDLKVTSPGAVIRPGDTIAEIVPSDAKMLIEARIRPEEISYVAPGQTARVKFTAFKYRNASMVEGKVTYVSADRLLDEQTRSHYYSVMITADVEKLTQETNFKIQAGMPSEVYIDGARQTPLEYMMDPLTSTLRRSARQL